jgi:hypothetical protein
MGTVVVSRAMDPTISPFQNIMVNGGFEVWQRGTVFNGSANAQLTADRWKNSYAGSPTVNVTQESTIVHDGLYSMKVAITVNASGIWGMGNNVENFQAYRGKILSLSVWINTTMTNVNIALYDGINAPVGSAFHPGDGTWRQLTVTATIATNATGVISFVTQETAGVTGTLYVDSAMLVLGQNPVDYVPEQIADELSRCLRYYETGSYISLGAPVSADTTNPKIYFNTNFMVQKSVAPTMTATLTNVTMTNSPSQGAGLVNNDQANWSGSTASGDNATTQRFRYFAQRTGLPTGNVALITGTWIADTLS